MTTSDAAPDTPLPTAPLPTDSLRLYRVGNATRRDFLRLGWLKRTFWVVADTADHAAEAALAAGRIDQLEDADVTDQTMIQIYKLAHSIGPRVEGLSAVLTTPGEVRIEIRSVPGGPRVPSRWIHWPKTS